MADITRVSHAIAEPSIDPASLARSGCFSVSARFSSLAILLLYGVTLFVSASLLFLVQPMFARLVLPRLGGTPAVWNTCMVFFQACLLAGYLYAHLTPRWFGLRKQSIVHLVALALPLFFLPLRLPANWSPAGGNPIASMLLVLAGSVGLPFLVVSTTGPLLQKWFTASGHRAAADPYFLYAAGNAGSLLALIGYPACIEPFLRVVDQTRIWSYGYGLLYALVITSAICLWRTGPSIWPIRSKERDQNNFHTNFGCHGSRYFESTWGFAAHTTHEKRGGGGADIPVCPGTKRQTGMSAPPCLVFAKKHGSFLDQTCAPGSAERHRSRSTATCGTPIIVKHDITSRSGPSRTFGARLHWIVLAFVPSSYLLGVTTFITTDIAAVPLLWVVPLALYLLSFVLVFLKNPPLPHATVKRLVPVAAVGVALFQLVHAAQPVWLILLVHLLAFCLAALACHGELARRRPQAEYLTDFYLLMSVGGVLGGLFNALLAPALFNRTYEYPIVIVLSCLLSARSTRASRTPKSTLLDLALPALTGTIALLAAAWCRSGHAVTLLFTAGLPVMMCMSFRSRRGRFALTLAILLGISIIHVPGGGRAMQIRRSFYGVHRIVLATDGQTRELFHGATVHGRQRYDTRNQPIDEPLTYYHRTGPVGDIFAMLPHGKSAVIGLGVGSLAAYARIGDTMTYYEIDRDVLWAADESGSFHFLSTARRRGADLNVILGDARLTLANAPDRALDLLILDAFSGDAVPVHLLTREALAIYLRKLSPRGVLGVHISNIYLDLKPILAALASDAGCTCLSRDDLDVTPEEMAKGKSPSQWVVLARDGMSLKLLKSTGKWEASDGRRDRPWTDDFSNVMSVMRWRR
jgi:hypothetical protein